MDWKTLAKSVGSGVFGLLKVVVQSPAAGVAVAFLLAILLLGQCRARQQAESDADAARRQAQAADDLRRQNQIPVDTVADSQALAAKVGALLKENAVLRQKVAEFKKMSPGAKPVAVVEGGTTPAPAAGPAAPAAPGKPCLLFEGEPLQLKLAGVVWEAQANVLALTATLAAEAGSPPRLLLKQPLAAPLTYAYQLPVTVRQRGWLAVGPVFGWVNGHQSWGAQVAFPRVEIPVLKWEIEPTASGAAGGGQWAVFAAALVRP